MNLKDRITGVVHLAVKEKTGWGDWADFYAACDYHCWSGRTVIVLTDEAVTCEDCMSLMEKSEEKVTLTT